MAKKGPLDAHEAGAISYICLLRASVASEGDGIQTAIPNCIRREEMKQLVQAIEILNLVVEESQDLDEVANALTKISVLKQALDILRGGL